MTAAGRGPGAFVASPLGFHRTWNKEFACAFENRNDHKNKASEDTITRFYLLRSNRIARPDTPVRSDLTRDGPVVVSGLNN